MIERTDSIGDVRDGRSHDLSARISVRMASG